MILDFGESADNSHQNIARSQAELFPKRPSAFFPVSKHTEVESQGYYSELMGAANSKFPVDLPSLLLTDNDDAVRYQKCQGSFYRQEETGLERSVITVEDVPVVSVHETASSRVPKEQMWS